MSNFKVETIKEVLYSVGNWEKVLHFFCEYGGWNKVVEGSVPSDTLAYWQLPTGTTAKEVLLQSNHHPTGQLRLVKFQGVEQEYIRSSQQPWDVGGIMDINLRVHEVASTFEELRELGWHGLSDPLLQEMGPFKLYDILMKGYDDVIIAFTKPVQPPIEYTTSINLPTHIYNSSITVSNLEAARYFYAEQLGCQLLNEYSVKKDSPQENMFGLPFNLADKVTCKANMFSFDGTRDVIFQIVEFDGVHGKDTTAKAKPPNRGFLLYRVAVIGLEDYYITLLNRNTTIYQTPNRIKIAPYGDALCFSVLSPNGVIWEFFEVI